MIPNFAADSSYQTQKRVLFGACVAQDQFANFEERTVYLPILNAGPIVLSRQLLAKRGPE
jgi:hypothetical protein